MNPDVDLVMMSKASDSQLAAMTQRAINTAKRGAWQHVVNVVVVEQIPGQRYKNAHVIYMDERTFNYNRSANTGAKEGQAPWIVFANNDLRFEPGWLAALLRARHPAMSPYNPSYHRHLYCLHNEAGWQVGRHLSGWCFMMARSLWEDLGGLDETYPFWCSDNAVMDQLRAKDIQPVLVRGSVVHHEISATLSREDPAVQDALTWAAVYEYNQTAEHKACEGDHRYEAWMDRRIT